MAIHIEGDALKLLQDFVKYALLDTEAVADAMMYNPDGLIYRARLLAMAISPE